MAEPTLDAWADEDPDGLEGRVRAIEGMILNTRARRDAIADDQERRIAQLEEQVARMASSLRVATLAFMAVADERD